MYDIYLTLLEHQFWGVTSPPHHILQPPALEVVTWGDADSGGDSSGVREQLRRVQ